MKTKITLLWTLLLLIFAVAQDTEKHNIAIMDLDGLGLPEHEATILVNKLRSEIVTHDVYNVLDRGEMGAIMQEQGFQQTGCTSSECAVELGQILGVSYIVSGSVGKIGNIYYVELKMINVETSQIIKSVDKSISGGIEAVLLTAMPEIAAKLCGSEVTKSTQVVAVETPKDTVKDTIPQTVVPTTSGEGSSNTKIRASRKGSEIYVDGQNIGKDIIVKRLSTGSHIVTEMFGKKTLSTDTISVPVKDSFEYVTSPREVKFVLGYVLSFMDHPWRDSTDENYLSFSEFWSDERVYGHGVELGILVRDRYYLGGEFSMASLTSTKFQEAYELDDVNVEFFGINIMGTFAWDYAISDFGRFSFGPTSGLRLTRDVVEYPNDLGLTESVSSFEVLFGGITTKLSLGYRPFYISLRHQTLFGYYLNENTYDSFTDTGFLLRGQMSLTVNLVL